MTNFNDDFNQRDFNRSLYQNEDKVSFVGVSIAAAALLVMLGAFVFFNANGTAPERSAANQTPATTSTTPPSVVPPRPSTSGPNG